VAPATPHTVTQDGSRVVVRFEADALDATLPSTPAPDMVQAVRVDGNSAVTIDLGPRAASHKASDVPGTRGDVRIVVEVIAKTTDTPEPPTAPPTTPDPIPPLDLVPPGGLRTVVIDPGHGGSDEGSRGSAGTLEKNVTMSVARRLKAALEARLGVRVILTREGDSVVGLDERAALANNNKADLFVSLHANASVRPAASGAEVFYLSLGEYGDEAQRAAAAPGESLPVFGGGTRNIEVVPWGMAQVRHIDSSAAFAGRVEAALRTRVTMSPRSIMQAPLRVLVGANMPAVLVEMGFITNPEQEKLLAGDQYQNDVVQALMEAIIGFRDQGMR
jgi:N-acetylmuramoyl-L-alanine amidase